MKPSFYTYFSMVVIITPVWADPATMDGKILEVCMHNGQAAFAEYDESPTVWQKAGYSSLYIHFPNN